MAAREFHRQRCIGTGSFGKVWLVVYSGNNKTYALKEMKVRGLTSKEINQAITEVKVLSQLGHFNIIRYKQAFVNDDTLNIAMEYAEGGDLAVRIQKQSATGVFFEESRVLNWFTQICFALKYIHKHNILHRDLKPQNVFLTKTNVVKVGDFGVAKVLLTDSGVAETAIGTPYYISPELCQSKPYNKKSDIWALGCLLYELATLKHAFNGSNFNNLVVKILRGEYGRLPSHYPFHPTSTLIQHMLLQLPEDRPTVDHLLQLPSLKSHITRYEQLVLRLTEEKRAKKKSSVNSSLTKEDSKSVSELTPEADLSMPPSSQKLSVLRRELKRSAPAASHPLLLPKSRPPLRREHSKSVPEQLSQSDKSPRVNNRRRAFSARAGKQQKSDLRRAVILKQAIAWKSSNISSLNDLTPPNLSPVHSDVSHTLCTPTTDEVFKDNSGDQKPCVDACCGAMLAAMGGGHTDKSAEQLFEMLRQRIGQDDTNALMAKLKNYLEENANISQSHFSMAVIKPFLPESVTSEELLLALNILNVKRQQTQIFMER